MRMVSRSDKLDAKKAAFRQFVIRILKKLLELCYIFLAKCFLKITVCGQENAPAEKSSLIVCNHVSFADGVILCVALNRKLRFIVHKDYYNRRYLRPLLKLLDVIPISEKDHPREIIASLRKARQAMDNGDSVCIFAEGAITRNGMMQAFKSGFRRIMKDSDYNIVPAFIGGMWDSVYSYYYGKPFSKLPIRFKPPVGVYFGEPLPSDSTAGEIREKVSELSCDYFNSLKPRRLPLVHKFIKKARSHWFKRCMADSTGKCLTYGKTLIASIILSELLRERTKDQEKVAILMPTSVAGALANIALSMLNKVTVNLNYTASAAARAHAIKQCEIKTIVTSKMFLRKLGHIEKTDKMIFMEDLMGGVTGKMKVAAIVKALSYPCNKLAPIPDFKGDSLASVIYSSGSSGMPKGVMLSHHNIISNIESAKMIFKIMPNDDMCGVLPFFHSFGFTCTLWLPIITGISATYIANPLESETVGKMVHKYKSTVFLGTPTFLAAYTRKVPKEHFESLRMVFVGAEKLKRKIADSFYRKYGKVVFEGYGATELSPVATINLPDVQDGGVFQQGNKPGAIGHSIPGVAVKILDVETGEKLPLGQQGLMYVKGPNVMLGYLDMPHETAEVLQDGWYNTGDIVRIGSDGFITLSDRLSRFSKIGGEMVPHLAIEEVYMDAYEADHQVIAVTSIPNDRKGEELIVLYLPEVAGSVDELHEAVVKSELPNIWKPKRNNYFQIDRIPILGSGKLDILRLRKLALEAKIDEASA